MKQSFISLTIFVNAYALSAQTSIPLLGSTDLAPRQKSESIIASPKYTIAQSVYRKLAEARGDRRYPVPKFVMSRATAEGATMNYDSTEITLEEKAYDVCASFGAERDAALAIILGHELTHYYEKHGWRRGFANEYGQLKIGMKLSAVQDIVNNETQADYLGGFLAYSAGFGLFDKCPDLIQGLYKAYSLPDTLSGYPVLQDRQEMSRLTIKKIELLVDAFEVANLMTAIGNFSEARLYYQYVLKDYQSREIYNNIGVTALLEVLAKSELKMLYPVELDLKSRSGRGGDGFASRRETLLRLAIKQFDAAISLDPDYAPAYLNKACAYALLDDLNRAQFYAETEAKSIAKAQRLTKTESDANILLGIIAYTRGDSIKARQLFEAEADSNALATRNLRILLHQPDEAPAVSMFAGSTKSENIDSTALASFAVSPKFDKARTQKIDEKTILFQYPIPNKSSKIYICQNDAGDETAFTYFHLTKANYKGKTAKDIGIGARREDILAAYKIPERTVETPKGEILVFKKLIFILDAEGKLIQWVNYQLP